MIIIQLVNGLLKGFERKHYPSTGKVVERVYPVVNGAVNPVPEDVRVVTEGAMLPNHSKAGIHNQEFLLYAHYSQQLLGI